ncbi:tetratricopeptide repeat protein [Methylobacterium persicinum]
MLDHGGGSAGQRRLPGAAERFLSKAVAHREAGRLDKARRNIDRALEIAPDHANARYELGVLLSRDEGPAAAVPHFAAALKGAQSKASYWIALLGALLESQRIDEAKLIAERFRATGLAETATAALGVLVKRAVDLGKGLYEVQDFARAEAYLEFAIAMDETHPDATFLAGAIAARTNRLQMAFDLMSIAIYRTPDRALYFAGLGAVLNMMDDEGARFRPWKSPSNWIRTSPSPTRTSPGFSTNAPATLTRCAMPTGLWRSIRIAPAPTSTAGRS